MIGKILWLLAALLILHAHLAEAQQPNKIPRLAYVSVGSDPPGPNIEALRQGLRNLGYIEGKNIIVEYRYLHGDRAQIPNVVSELIQLKVDVLMSGTPPVIRAFKEATRTVPIVIVTTQDPIVAGYAGSLAHPGGNITGLTRMTRDLSENGWKCLKKSSRRYRVSRFCGMQTAPMLVSESV